MKYTRRVTKRTGLSDRTRDFQRFALLPGKRISATGKVYYENRRNRSDVRGKKY